MTLNPKVELKTLCVKLGILVGIFWLYYTIDFTDQILFFNILYGVCPFTLRMCSLYLTHYRWRKRYWIYNLKCLFLKFYRQNSYEFLYFGTTPFIFSILLLKNSRSLIDISPFLIKKYFPCFIFKISTLSRYWFIFLTDLPVCHPSPRDLFLSHLNFYVDVSNTLDFLSVFFLISFYLSLSLFAPCSNSCGYMRITLMVFFLSFFFLVFLNFFVTDS